MWVCILVLYSAIHGEVAIPCMRVSKYISEMAQPLCWEEREDVILVQRGRKKWTAIGLGEGRRKLTT